MIYEVGDVARTEVTYKDVDGNLINPSQVTVTVTAPDGVVNTYTISTLPPVVNDSVGKYHCDISITVYSAVNPFYTAEWVALGNVAGAGFDQFTVAGPLPQTPIPGAFNLCTLDDVHAWLGDKKSSDDELIQRCIFHASSYWLWRTGRGSQDGSAITNNPYVAPVAYDEWYDGNGNQKMFVRNAPIQSVQLITANGVAVTQSTSPIVWGWFIDTSRKCIVLRGANGAPVSTWAGYWQYRGMGRSMGWPRGVANINVQYTAGYNQTPPDIVISVAKMVSLNYKRRQWQDMKENSQGDTFGKVVYRDWELPPDVCSVLDNYSRSALV